MNNTHDIRQSLLDKAHALPKSPGVYLMKDDKGVVLYVGKARVLPSRVVNYFVPSADHGPKKNLMLPLIADFDVLICESEWEALLTENRLIKDLKPKFNELLTDDRTFPYLVITTRDEFPGIFITRQPRKPEYKGAKIYGPFTGVHALHESIKMLQRVFKFRTCHLDIRDDDDKRQYFRPCLLHPIKQCTAPCAAKISKEDYREDIRRLIRFLDSKRSIMIRELEEEMQAASKSLEFEKAAALRDQIHALQKLDERGKFNDNWQPESEFFVDDPVKGLDALRKTLGLEHEIRCLECIDIAHLQGESTVGSKVSFIDGRPFKDGYRRYKIKSVTNDDYAAIQEVIARGFRDAAMGQELYPDVLIIDGGKGQLSAAMEVFAEFDFQPPAVISLAKKEELIYTPGESEPIKLGRNNLGLKLCQALRDEAHRFAQHYHHILRNKKMLEGADPIKKLNRDASAKAARKKKASPKGRSSS